MIIEDAHIYLYKLMRLLLTMFLGLSIYYLVNIGNNFIDEDKRISLDLKYILPGLLGLIVLFSLFNLFRTYSILSDTFFTVIISIVLAYLLNPLIDYFESKGLTRLKAVLLLYLLILGGFMIFAFLILPRSAREIKKFIHNAPLYVGKFSELIDQLIGKYDLILGDLPLLSSNIKDAVRKNIAGMEDLIINAFKSFFYSLVNVFAKVVSLVLTPILTLYFLVDKDYFLGKVTRLIPENRYDDSMELFREIDNSLSMFVRGRLFMAVYVGVSISLVLLILGVDFALPIGFITGFADIIPYVGPFLGFIPAVFFALLQSPGKAIWVSLIFLIIQWTENNVLAPKVIGDTTGLHPMIILLSIIVGGGVFGVMGMIFSVPLVAVAIILYKHFKEKPRE